MAHLPHSSSQSLLSALSIKKNRGYLYKWSDLEICSGFTRKKKIQAEWRYQINLTFLLKLHGFEKKNYYEIGEFEMSTDIIYDCTISFQINSRLDISFSLLLSCSTNIPISWFYFVGQNNIDWISRDDAIWTVETRLPTSRMQCIKTSILLFVDSLNYRRRKIYGKERNKKKVSLCFTAGSCRQNEEFQQKKKNRPRCFDAVDGWLTRGCRSGDMIWR
jgi:hypothetical protein